MFHSPYINKRKAQLIFATHNVAVIDHARLDDDQIWLMKKNEDLATELYPYSDFDSSCQSTFMFGYLDGRYGAIPRVLRTWL